MRYIREYYGVPAEIGGRIKFTSEGYPSAYATIVGSRNARIIVRFDGSVIECALHPTWRVEYLKPGETK